MKILKFKLRDKILSITGLILFIAAVSGVIFEKSIRFGFFVSLFLVVIIGIVTLIMSKMWKKSKKDGGNAARMSAVLKPE